MDSRNDDKSQNQEFLKAYLNVTPCDENASIGILSNKIVYIQSAYDKPEVKFFDASTLELRSIVHFNIPTKVGIKLPFSETQIFITSETQLWDSTFHLYDSNQGANIVNYSIKDEQICHVEEVVVLSTYKMAAITYSRHQDELGVNSHRRFSIWNIHTGVMYDSFKIPTTPWPPKIHSFEDNTIYIEVKKTMVISYDQKTKKHQDLLEIPSRDSVAYVTHVNPAINLMQNRDSIDCWNMDDLTYQPLAGGVEDFRLFPDGERVFVKTCKPDKDMFKLNMHIGVYNIFSEAPVGTKKELEKYISADLCPIILSYTRTLRFFDAKKIMSHAIESDTDQSKKVHRKRKAFG